MRYSLLLLFLLVGCTHDHCMDKPDRRSYDHRNLCTEDSINDRASFILECVGNANPYSDEEPQHWIDQCASVAVKTYCPKQKVTVTMATYKSIGPFGCAWRETNVELAPL